VPGDFDIWCNTLLFRLGLVIVGSNFHDIGGHVVRILSSLSACVVDMNLSTRTLTSSSTRRSLNSLKHLVADFSKFVVAEFWFVFRFSNNIYVSNGL